MIEEKVKFVEDTRIKISEDEYLHFEAGETVIIREAKFATGMNLKVMQALESRLSKNHTFKIDYDIIDSYKTPQGTMVGYYVDIGKERELRINYLEGDNNGTIATVDLIEAKDTYENPSKTLVFSPDINNRELTRAIEGLITGTLEEDTEKKSEIELEEKRVPIKKQFDSWINDPVEREQRLEILQKEKLTATAYTSLIQSLPDGETPMSLSSFVSTAKEYLKKNGLTNVHTRGAYQVKKNQILVSVIADEEKEGVKEISEASDIAFSWRELFQDLQDDFEEMMSDPYNGPFGVILHGNGGTGKSYYFEEKAGEYRTEPIKGALNTSKLVRELYNRRKDKLVIFDDADSVVTTNNSANILKSATDDTVRESDREGRAIIYLPKSSGADMKGIVPDVYNSHGELIDAFYFYPQIVIITNLTDIRDKALKSRLYVETIFMTKDEIIEKISETSNYKRYGATQAQNKEVMKLLVSLIEGGVFDIKDEKVTYRFYKQGIKFVKLYPNWAEKVMRKLDIGIRSGADYMKIVKQQAKAR